VDAGAVTNGEIQVYASQSFLDAYEIERITPEPDSASLAAGGVNWTFAASEMTEPGSISLLVRPVTIGVQRGELGLAGGEQLTIRQFIYP
jgi:hypothetical protein